MSDDGWSRMEDGQPYTLISPLLKHGCAKQGCLASCTDRSSSLPISIALRFVNRDPIAELTILCTGVKQICPIVPLYLRMSAARFRLLAAACDDSALSRSAGWIPRAFMLLGPYAIQEASLRQ